LYGHEHFGFKDGLSQPEVRGKYKQSQDNTNRPQYDFVVRRVLDPEDPRFVEYAQPGFRLLDAGNFLLGYEREDTNESNYNDNSTLPSYFSGSSYLVFRKLEQDVPSFWLDALSAAQDINQQHKLNLSEEEIKTLAGQVASKLVGRYWDGTPLIYDVPFSGKYLPPNSKDNYKFHDNEYMDWRENGFEFDNQMDAWKLANNKYVPKNKQAYAADPDGQCCPFAAHIRKINPRDQSTDMGPNSQTLKHRLIRRAINYGDQIDNIWKNDNKKRGLLFLSYQASIENQFEFLQRHWANSSTRPTSGGDDMIIGQPADTDGEFERATDIHLKILTKNMQSPVEIDYTVKSMSRYIVNKGTGYFLTIPKTAIWTITNAPLLPSIHSVSSKSMVFYHSPGNQYDFELEQTQLLWDWTMKYMYWSCIWTGCDTTTPSGALTQTVVPTFGTYAAGIVYRLPDWKEIGDNYKKNMKNNTNNGDSVANKPSYLQFRSTDEIYQLVKLAHGNVNKDIATVTIAWAAFPKRIKTLFGDDPTSLKPYEYVEQVGWPPKDITQRSYAGYQPLARQMDEYCEWYTHRDPKTGKITKIDISVESPEYWAFLFNNEPDTCVKLYQQYVSPLVKKEDLMDNIGNYNVYNKWNTIDGIMHLNCPPNSLFAEVYIAAEASTYWKNCEGKILTEAQALIDCAQYGLETRNSDPTIGDRVNSLIRKNFIVSIENPVGLYLQDLNTTGWMKPNGTPFNEEEIKKIVKYRRGTPGRWLRVEISIPQEYNYTLGDCTIGGIPILYAGQVIDASCTMYLNGIGIDGEKFGYVKSGASQNAAVPCKSKWSVGNGVGPYPEFTSYVIPPQPDFSKLYAKTTPNVKTTCSRKG
jgi:Dyp-type peroxidase family